MGRNYYGPIVTWADFVMDRNDTESRNHRGKKKKKKEQQQKLLLSARGFSSGIEFNNCDFYHWRQNLQSLNMKRTHFNISREKNTTVDRLMNSSGENPMDFDWLMFIQKHSRPYAFGT